MTNDTAITRLLYAIISQKCLKDIDWNKVAHDPILSQEITNGHAARMRYSRFKKQMDGTSTVRRPRNPNSPRKSKVEKNKSPRKVKDRTLSDDEETIKLEGTMGYSGLNTAEGNSQMNMGDLALQSQEASPIVKTEPGISSFCSSATSYANTPHDPQTPNPVFDDVVRSVAEMGTMDEMDDLMACYDMPMCGPASHDHAMYQPMMADSMGHQHGYSVMGYPYEQMWHHAGVGGNGMLSPDRSSDDGVFVKAEPR